MQEVMKEELKKLDMSMKALTLDLVKYSKDSLEYQRTLNELAQQYQNCKTILDLFKDSAKDDINEPYFLFEYADIGQIETLLSNAGYLEQPKKPTSL